MTNTDEKLITRIGNLLRQAEGTDNTHEAEAFTQAAQRLATAASIDLEIARTAAANRDKAATPVVKHIKIGEAGKRGLKTYAQLFIEIARANDVTVDIAHNSTFVLAFGYETDIDVVEALYMSLVVQMVSAADAYLTAGEWRAHTVARVERRRDFYYGVTESVVHRPLTKVTARLQFHSAFASRIGSRLKEARDAEIAEREAAERDANSHGETSTALVLKAKSVAVQDFYSTTSQARGSWRPSRGDAYADHARRAGDRAGRSASLGGDSSSLPASRRELGA